MPELICEISASIWFIIIIISIQHLG